jgi:hypothetical protein
MMRQELFTMSRGASLTIANLQQPHVAIDTQIEMAATTMAGCRERVLKTPPCRTMFSTISLFGFDIISLLAFPHITRSLGASHESCSVFDRLS